MVGWHRLRARTGTRVEGVILAHGAHNHGRTFCTAVTRATECRSYIRAFGSFGTTHFGVL